MKALSWLEPQTTDIGMSTGPYAPPAPSTDWLGALAKPWATFGTRMATAAASTYEDLPARLFDWGMDELGGSEKRTVPQGAGVSTTYVQQAQPGGAPAAPNYTVIQPGQQQGPGGIVQAPAAAGLSTFALVGIGLIIYLAVKK